MPDTPVRVYPLVVNVSPGTLPAAPLSTPWKTEDNTLISIELEIPPGHNGLTGIRIMKGDTQLLPFGSNSWIIANGYTNTFAIDDYMPTGDIKVQAYNQGAYPHTFYLRMSMVNYDVAGKATAATEADVLALAQIDVIADPLSPDMLLGVDTTAALVSGTVTADQLAPIAPSSLMQNPVTP